MAAKTEPHRRIPVTLVTGFLHREPGGGWLPPDSSQRLGRCWFVERNASSVMALHGATRKTGGVISCESLQPTALSHRNA